MAPIKSYTNWNSRATDQEEQVEPYENTFSFVKEQIQKHGILRN